MEDVEERDPSRRTPQACATCRKRKTKCDGHRPRCSYCTKKRLPCVWTSFSANEPPKKPSADQAHVGITAASPAAWMSSDGQEIILPSLQSLRRTLELFYKFHFINDFCSFEMKSKLELHHQESPFLIVSIITLCAQYLTPGEAQKGFGLGSAYEVWHYYCSVARGLSRNSTDVPTLQNIKGNLVLALSELLSNSSSNHWMYAGTAIRMAQIMRLNKEYHQKHDLEEQEMRRRTLWACLLMDRSLAFFLSKPRTLSLANIDIALPLTDVALAWQDRRKGMTLRSLAAFEGYPSEIGLMPYFIKTLCLWSDMADHNICHRRFTDDKGPLDPGSDLFRGTQAMQAWSDGAGAAVCISTLVDAQRAMYRAPMLLTSAGWMLAASGSHGRCRTVTLHREPSLISICVSNALAVGDIVTQVCDTGSRGRSDLETMWLAYASLPAANTFLWLQYAKDEEFSGEYVIEKTKCTLQIIKSLLSGLGGRWKIAHDWLTTLQMMEATYRAAYLGEVPPDSEIQELSPRSTEGQDPGTYRPQPGDGCPPVEPRPSLYASLRMITTESTFEELGSVWMYLAGGWSEDLQDLILSSLDVVQ